DIVVDGMVLRVDRRSVVDELARDILPERLPVLDRLPVEAHLPAGTDAVRAPGFGTGFLLNGQLWPVTSTKVAELNDSTVELIDQEEWESYPVGPTLGS